MSNSAALTASCRSVAALAAAGLEAHHRRLRAGLHSELALLPVCRDDEATGGGRVIQRSVQAIVQYDEITMHFRPENKRVAWEQ